MYSPQAGETIPGPWLFKSEVKVSDGTIFDFVPLFFCTFVEQFWTSTSTSGDWKLVRAEQQKTRMAMIVKVGIFSML